MYKSEYAKSFVPIAKIQKKRYNTEKLYLHLGVHMGDNL